MVKGFLTIVPSSKGPHSASILWQSNSMGATTGHLSHIADVFNQGRNVSAVAVTVTCDQSHTKRHWWMLPVKHFNQKLPQLWFRMRSGEGDTYCKMTKLLGWIKTLSIPNFTQQIDLKQCCKKGFESYPGIHECEMCCKVMCQMKPSKLETQVFEEWS